MTCEPQLVAAASGPGRDRTDGRVPLSSPSSSGDALQTTCRSGSPVSAGRLGSSRSRGAFFDERPQGAGERACPAAPVRIAKMRVASLRVTPCDSQICETAMRSSECPTGRPKKEGRGGFGGCEDRDEREEPGEPRQRLHGPHGNPAQTPSGSTDAVGEGAEAAVAAEPARFSGAFAAALLEMTKKPGDVGRPGSRKVPAEGLSVAKGRVDLPLVELEESARIRGEVGHLQVVVGVRDQFQRIVAEGCLLEFGNDALGALDRGHVGVADVVVLRGFEFVLGLASTRPCMRRRASGAKRLCG